MRRLSIVFAVLAGTSAAAAPCITEQSQFGSYKQALAQEAASQGVGQTGLQALANVQLSGITWRFESRPSSQTGVSYRDPAEFLARRSGSTAENFIAIARRKKEQNAAFLASVENAYGVSANILVTIWMLETGGGSYLGETPVLGGAVTLSSYCRRHPRFVPDAIAALKMVDSGMITASTKGGPSGELGHMQFLPSNWLRFGVDGTGDGVANPYDAGDAIASAANMLRQGGWRAGQPFGEGTANFGVLSVWNDSGNYQRAIAYAAERI